MALLDDNRLFPTDSRVRGLAQEIYSGIKGLPIISPHGHTDPRWFALDEKFPNPARLFVQPDHYVFRMLCSQGVDLDTLGIPRADGSEGEKDPRKIWQVFAEHFYLLRGTPSWIWLNHAFQEVFGLTETFGPDTAADYYDHIDVCLKSDDFRPRALFERFNIEALSTTEMALDDLKYHKMIAESDWQGRVISAYRPDNVIDPDFDGFAENLDTFGDLTGEDTGRWQGYLNAHRVRRAYFKEVGGVTSSDHGHPTARTENLDAGAAAALFDRVRSGKADAEERDAFRGQMLTEMAKMSLEDGLTMQIHAGSHRNHSQPMLELFGRDKGFDIPTRTDFVNNLKPLLNAVGMERDLTVIVFMLDETTQSRELAPLAGVYPALRLGPPWWFHDSYEGMKRFRENVTETAGFYNTVGFNDDTRAFCSIPARHDVARRVDAGYLAELVATGRLNESEAHEVARDLTYNLVKAAYNL
ncbi:glucuronate isomerase [Celeribacter sp.]|uniref:glucuronate isomerase n=1 Tax=Celeribacter sp. TaxID=1890673 RepID=UPI003A940378